MTTTPRILRNCALALPLVILGWGGLAGPRAAAEVAIGGAFGLVNWIALAWLGTGFVREAAFGGSGIHGALLTGKMGLAVVLFIGLLDWIAPLNAVVGLTAPVLGVLATGIELAFVDPGPEPVLAPGESDAPSSAPDLVES